MASFSSPPPLPLRTSSVLQFLLLQGCAAAVGPTLIPLLLRAKVSPQAAGAAILAGTFGSMLSPGLSHNAYVAKISGLSVMQTIGVHMNYTLVCGAIAVIGVTVMCWIMKDYGTNSTQEQKLVEEGTSIQEISLFKALAPLIPVAILVIGNLWVPALKNWCCPSHGYRRHLHSDSF